MKKLIILLLICNYYFGFSQITLIPDPIFEQALIDNGIDTDNTINGQVLDMDINSVVTLYLQGLGINDLTGIEGFIALENLNCRLNNLTTIDLSQNLNLKNLNCGVNDFTQIDLSQNVLLEFLKFNIVRNIQSIDLNSNTLLKEIEMIGNWDIENLDVSSLINLEMIVLRDNWSLNSIDFSNNTNLETLIFDATFSALQVLNVQNNTNLKTLSFTGFDISTIDLSNCLLLETLFCPNNALTQLDLSSNIALKFLDCGDHNDDFGLFNSIQNLDLSNNVNLEYLNCNRIGLQNLTTTNCTLLKEIYCSINPLNGLNLSDNVNLENLNAQSCHLNTLDISNNINLENIYLGASQIGWSHLTYGNDFFEINLNNQPNLNFVELSYNENLETIYIQNQNNNQLTLNANNNPLLNCVFVDDTSIIPISWQVEPTSHYVETISECETLIVNDIYQNMDIKLFPNPAFNYFSITTEIKKITIFSVLGKKVKSFNNQFNYDITDISKGIYQVVIMNNNGLEIRRKLIIN